MAVPLGKIKEEYEGKERTTVPVSILTELPLNIIRGGEEGRGIIRLKRYSTVVDEARASTGLL
jgi:hypothetical protein